MGLIFRPLRPGDWPGSLTPARDRPFSRFKAGWRETVTLLGAEVDKLGATDVVLQVDAPECAMRLDGSIRADAKVNDDGIIISFESRQHGPLRYACDTYTGHGQFGYLRGWQANVRAVALTLEALRSVDRWGAAKSGEQYRGWSALPPAREAGRAMSVDEAERLLADECGISPRMTLIGSRPAVQVAYREAAKRHHPDAGGDPAMFRRLTEARDLLLAGAS